MTFQRKFFLFLGFFILVLSFISFNYFNISRKIELKLLGINDVTSDTRQPKEINVLGKTKVKYPQDYTVVMLGDSMTEKLGNSDELKVYLKKYFPLKSFQILNYGFGSTNVLSAQDRLEKETFYGRVFKQIVDIAFDLILIESFGNNPLSQFPLDEGLKKQTEALDKIVETIKVNNPTAKIVFVATIAPNRLRYGEGQVNLEPEKRAQWADERIVYIKNHINYASTHQLPLINIYEKTLNGEQGGNLDYISSDDFIHPSASGVYFISEQIAKSLYEQKLLVP